MNNKRLFGLTWSLFGIFLFLIGRDWYLTIPEFGAETIFRSVRAQILLGYIILALAFWILGWRYSTPRIFPSLKIIGGIQDFTDRLPVWMRWLLAIGLVLLLPAIKFFSPLAYQPIGIWLQLALLMFVGAVANFLIYPHSTLDEWIHRYFYTFVFVSAVFFSGSLLTQVSDYPFSIGWSDGNRLWDYSVHIGANRYLVPDGVTLKAFISRFRELLNGLVYFIPNVGIFGVRLWVTLLQIIPIIVLGALLISDNKNYKAGASKIVLFAAWTFLFLFQGPIQSRLVVVAVIMVFGTRSKNLLIASILVMVAGYLAFYSRWTWTYAPGLWAGMIALLQAENPTFKRKDWHKLSRPIIMGISGYFGGQILPSLSKIPAFEGSGPKLSAFVDTGIQVSFGQPLLWYRWLPNSTFSPGILLALLAAVGPLLILLFLANKYGGFKPNRMQVIGVSTTLFVFMVVGLVASTKIGGGGDLHNMDMFLIGLIIVSSFAWPHILQLLKGGKHKPILVILGYLLLCTPVLINMSFLPSSPPKLPSEAVVSDSLGAIRSEVLSRKDLGEVLFMDQRQLLTFGYFADVPIVIDYEKKIVIDKAMQSDQEYFNRFYDDLKNHRFVIIVSELLYLKTGEKSKPFAEENDVWVTWVSIPILRYYKVLATFPEVGVQLLVPRTNLPINVIE